MRSVPLLALALLAPLPLLPRPASAEAPRNDLSDEVGFGTGDSAGRAARTGIVTDALAGRFGLDRRWDLDLELDGMWIGTTPGIARKEFGSRGGSVYDLEAGATFAATDHDTLGLSGGLSPRSRLVADTTVSYLSAAGVPTRADALLAASSSSVSGRASYGYDTAGLSDLETALDFDVLWNLFDTDQRIAEVRTQSGAPATAKDLRTYCESHRCSKQLLGLLRETPAAVNQVEFQVGATETIHADTDLGLSAGYYAYDRNPTEIGFFALAAAGRGGLGFGNGMPIAPLAWSVRPEVVHRFGDLGVRLWLEHGEYVSGEGFSDLASLKVQYRFSPRFRLWLTGLVERDQDSSSGVYSFWQATLGAMWSF